MVVLPRSELSQTFGGNLGLSALGWKARLAGWGAHQAGGHSRRGNNGAF